MMTIPFFLIFLELHFQVTVKQGNLILAVIMDILLGYIALQLLTEDKTDIGITLMGILEVMCNRIIFLTH